MKAGVDDDQTSCRLPIQTSWAGGPLAGGLLCGTGDGTAWEIVVAAAAPYDLDLQNADFFDSRATVVETGSGFVVIVFVVRQLVSYDGPIGDWLKLRRLARDSAARKAGAPGGEQVLLGLCRIGSVALAPSLT